MLEARNLVKTYTTGNLSQTVLKSLDFNVKKGEFVAITGRSGSGKSTLLYQLSLLDHPTSGQVLYNGVDMTHANSNARTNFRLFNLGYIFQDYALLPSLTAVENVMVPLLMKGMSKAEALAVATESLDQVGLKDKNGNLPSQLSGGQQQRVSIARSIAHKPQIIFADEPTANLDSETSDAIIKLFHRLNDDGQTIVMVTHESEYATTAHRRIFLADGQIVKESNHS